MAAIRLGLIGDHIARSQSPRLHVLAGRLCGLEVTYDRLIPADMGMDFGSVFDRCADEGYRGINVTYPYKETVVPRLTVPDPLTASIGACNTVLFGDGLPQGHNTDFSGFAAAFRASFGDVSPGAVAMAGAGGVGKAIAFALARLGARELRIYDMDASRARALAAALAGTGVPMQTIVAESIAAAADGSDGLINCTPIGMAGHPGSPFPGDALQGPGWAFDAVYTPVDTQFLQGAGAAGMTVMSGWELFFHQGVQAFRHFTGREVDAPALRSALLDLHREAVDG
ncbi:MAG: shikimate dehydrogenase [Aquamicrobium sp.]|nr:shikimate dehydrogenase [Aquamicrobium sp.]MBX9463263.1 shikimate dehydrogenase [Aquamicrobium sp.]